MQEGTSMKIDYRLLAALVLPVTLTYCGTEGNGMPGGATDMATNTGGDGGSSCPSDVFLDVSQAPGAGAGYPAPSLSVSCTDTTMTVTTNDIPPYNFVQTTPNPLMAKTFTFTVPLHPVRAAMPTTLVNVLGNFGFTVVGGQFFGPIEGTMPANEIYGDPVYNGLLDDCGGHTGPDDSYHNHELLQKCLVSSGLVAKPWMNPDPSPTTPSPILGFALDGFAVYGPYECTTSACTAVQTMQSSYQKTGNPTTYVWNAYTYVAPTDSAHLDECNGHVGPLGDYHYHATSGFPYIIGCYAGTTH
jgi:hypothetical protein